MDAYSGVLKGILAESQENRANEQAAINNELKQLQIEQTQLNLDEFKNNTELRELTNEQKVAQTQATLNELRAASELGTLTAGVAMVDEQNQPRSQYDIAKDIFASANLSTNPLVREQARTTLQKAAAEDVVRSAEVDPEAAFNRLAQLNLVQPGYSARVVGDQFQILDADGDVTQSYPAQAAGGIVRDFATGTSAALDAMLKARNDRATEAIKSANQLALEKFKQSAMDARAQATAAAALQRTKITSGAALLKALQGGGSGDSAGGGAGVSNYDPAAFARQLSGQTAAPVAAAAQPTTTATTATGQPAGQVGATAAPGGSSTAAALLGLTGGGALSSAASPYAGTPAAQATQTGQTAPATPAAAALQSLASDEVQAVAPAPEPQLSSAERLQQLVELEQATSAPTLMGGNRGGAAPIDLDLGLGTLPNRSAMDRRRSMMATQREAVAKRLPTMSPQDARAIANTEGLAGLGPNLFAKVLAKARESR